MNAPNSALICSVVDDGVLEDHGRCGPTEHDLVEAELGVGDGAGHEVGGAAAHEVVPGGDHEQTATVLKKALALVWGIWRGQHDFTPEPPRRLTPGSITQPAPERADGWIPGTRPGGTEGR